MIKDFLNRRRIDAKAREISAAIASRYPAHIDSRGVDRLGNKVSGKKAGMKLEKVILNARRDIQAAHGALGLGIYGKARLYKTVQSELFRQGYKEETVRRLMEKIIM